MHLIYSEGGAEVPALSGYYRNPAYFTRCEHDATLVISPRGMTTSATPIARWVCR